MNIVVLDTTALSLIGTGRLSSLIAAAHRPETDRRVLAPSMCLALVANRLIAEHVLMLPALDVVDLTASQAVGCAALLEQGLEPHHAPAAVVAASVAGVGGYPVLTAEPKGYDGTGITALQV